jgi:diaminopimelate decarboxylase
VRAGDSLAVFAAGAYGASMASNYNTRRRPAEVLVEGASARLVRRREEFAELWAQEILP